ncbi:MAG: hypothetical protein J6K74_01115, partial [Marinifilaceae bacterium]|nr:hypothetical protein [Marinifilaceae bacterium]
MKRVLCLLVSIVASCHVQSVKSQSFETDVANSFFDYVSSVRNEKVYLQTDRDSYQPGDTMFLRGFLFNATTNQEVDCSRYIYVDVVDRSGVLYWREKIAYNTQDSSFNGYFALADNLSQGEYYVRAFTYWMQEQGEEMFFRKRFYVINPFDHGVSCNMDVLNDKGGTRLLKINFVNSVGEKYQHIKFNYFIPGETPDTMMMTANTGYSGQTQIRIEDPNSDHIWIAFSHDVPWSFERYFKLPESKTDFDVQFFPEGGAMICGVEQRVALKSIGRDGLAVHVKGYIESAAGVKVVNVETNHLGMGSFIIEASPNEKYIAVLTTDDGNTKRIDIPVVESGEHYAVQLSQNGESVTYNVLANEGTDLSDKYIFINSRGMPMGVYPVSYTMGKPMDFSFAPEGIMNFTLIDKQGKVYSNRMWYHRHKPQQSLTISDGNQVTPRKEREVQIEFNSIGEADLAVSVVSEAHTTHLATTVGIEAYINLTSDLSGYIEDPEYYFTAYNNETALALDNLLLTQGWKRFDVTEVINDRIVTDSRFYIERGQSLSGFVRPYIGERADRVSNAKIQIIGDDGSAYETVADSSGHFVYHDMAFEVGTGFVVEALSNKGKPNVELTLEEPIFLDPLHFAPIGVCKADEGFYGKYGVDYIFSTDGSKVQTLGEVRVGAMSIEAQKEQFWTDFREHDARQNFLLGYTTVETFGYGPDGNPRYYEQLKWAVERGIMYYTSEPLPPPGSSSKDYKPSERKTFFYNGTLESIWGMEEEWIKRYRNIEQSGRAMNGEAPKMVINNLNDKAKIGVQTRMNNTPIEALPMGMSKEEYLGLNNAYLPIEYNYNIQTVVPFAPQKQGEVEFYKPKYNVPLNQMINDPIDAKATRYWNHKVVVRNGEPFEFSFPTAA